MWWKLTAVIMTVTELLIMQMQIFVLQFSRVLTDGIVQRMVYLIRVAIWTVI